MHRGRQAGHLRAGQVQCQARRVHLAGTRPKLTFNIAQASNSKRPRSKVRWRTHRRGNGEGCGAIFEKFDTGSDTTAGYRSGNAAAHTVGPWHQLGRSRRQWARKADQRTLGCQSGANSLFAGAVERGGLENLWPTQYRPIPISHSAPRIVGRGRAFVPSYPFGSRRVWVQSWVHRPGRGVCRRDHLAHGRLPRAD